MLVFIALVMNYSPCLRVRYRLSATRVEVTADLYETPFQLYVGHFYPLCIRVVSSHSPYRLHRSTFIGLRYRDIHVSSGCAAYSAHFVSPHSTTKFQQVRAQQYRLGRWRLTLSYRRQYALPLAFEQCGRRSRGSKPPPFVRTVLNRETTQLAHNGAPRTTQVRAFNKHRWPYEFHSCPALSPESAFRPAALFMIPHHTL